MLVYCLKDLANDAKFAVYGTKCYKLQILLPVTKEFVKFVSDRGE